MNTEGSGDASIALARMEVTYFARIITTMKEAIEILLEGEGYEDLDQDERDSIALRALKMVPLNIESRRLGSGLDFTKPISIAGHIPVSHMPVHDEFIESLYANNVETIDDLRRMSNEGLKEICDGLGTPWPVVSAIVEHGI